MKKQIISEVKKIKTLINKIYNLYCEACCFDIEAKPPEQKSCFLTGPKLVSVPVSAISKRKNSFGGQPIPV
jgi:hypothetical protein